MPTSYSACPVKKVILDENVPHALKQALAGHSVTTVQDQGWVAIIELPFNARRKVLPLAREILQAVDSAQINDYIQI